MSNHSPILEQYLVRIEALEEQRRVAAEEVKEILADMKITGFDLKSVKKMLKARLIERVKEIDASELYDSALGGEQ
jgi:uncharacterized protein (UPF0335 family)